MKQDTFGSLALRYVLGFAGALVLSVASYLVVTEHLMPTPYLAMVVVLIFAVIQLIVQLICFLHLRFTGRSRERAVTFSFTMFMMLVIVIGSIWIMKNLDYRMGMSGEAMNEYMKEQNKKGF
jgi:cytochrome o ubiquinol oxidase operon protein cyoD